MAAQDLAFLELTSGPIIKKGLPDATVNLLCSCLLFLPHHEVTQVDHSGLSVVQLTIKSWQLILTDVSYVSYLVGEYLDFAL